MSEGHNEMAQNRSMLKEFIGFIATRPGDLSNITAPPFVLDTKSTTELPAFWAENPSIFCAPAHSEDPAERALLVLKWYLSSLRNQNYMGHSEQHGVKKPLNAFLGELFLAKREDDMGTTQLVSEQVSHHPPITACRVWNEEHGVVASGYTRQTITFNGTVSIKQTGHALFNLEKRDETYLIPLPELKVRGVLTGTPYPELSGTYYIPSTNGYTSVISFSGKGWFHGVKHSFEASVFKEDEGEDHPIYAVKGTWNQDFTIHDVRKGEDIETFDVMANSTKVSKLIVAPLEEQDPWETRRAWNGVISALNKSDMKGTTDAKSKVEQGQRDMRKEEERQGQKWEQAFFKLQDRDEVAELLTRKIPGQQNMEEEKRETQGVWAFDMERWKNGISKPYHGEMVPDNSHNPTTIPTARSSIDSPTRTDSSSRASLSQTPRTSIDSQRPSSRKGSIASWFRLNHRDSSPSTINSASSTTSIPDSIKKIHKDTPGPQVDLVQKSEEAKAVGSGIEGMDLEEKRQLEEALRDLYMTGQPNVRKSSRSQRGSADSRRRSHLESTT